MSLFSIPLRPAKPRHHQTTPFIPTYILFDFIIAKDFPLSNRARWGEVRVGWWWWWWLTRGSARINLNWNVSPFSFTALASPAFVPNRQPNLYLWLLDFYLLFSIFFQYIRFTMGFPSKNLWCTIPTTIVYSEKHNYSFWVSPSDASPLHKYLKLPYSHLTVYFLHSILFISFEMGNSRGNGKNQYKQIRVCVVFITLHSHHSYTLP